MSAAMNGARDAPAVITVPDLDPDADSLALALDLARASIFTLPTSDEGDAKHAGSVVGKGWPSKSSVDPRQIAAWFAGSSYRVAVHCGRSGLIVVDVDHPDKLTPELRRAIDELNPPFQSTRPNEPGRGHYLFAQPPGRRLGNRAGQTGKEWGEWRGANGIILVGGEGRRWLRTGPVPTLPDYLANLLPDVGDSNTAVSNAEINRFYAAHTSMIHLASQEPILGAFTAAVSRKKSRHDSAMSAACWMVREAIEGRFPAKTALRKLEVEFVAALTETGRDSGPVSRSEAESEFLGVVAWAIAQEWSPTDTQDDVEGDEAAEEQPPREDPAAALQALAREIQIEVRRHTIEINAEAQRRHDEAQRPARPSLTSRLVEFADLANVPLPEMFINRLMPERAVGFFIGRSGSYKTFGLTALAMAIGSGKPVMGHHEFGVARRGRVLYVAAEGSSGVALRLRAYAAAHGITDAGVVLFPGAVNLAATVEVEELYGYAAEDGFTHVFVDTFRAATVGVQEKDNTEVGVVIAGAIRARDEHGLSTLYADHTGHAGERAVGAEAKLANVDYALMIHMPSDSRRADQQRTLRVEKFKDLETTGEWQLRLRPVPQVRDADDNPSAVIEIGPVDTASAFFDRDHKWWLDEVPKELADLIAGDGKVAAFDIVRILRHVGDEDGLSSATLAAMVKEKPTAPEQRYSKSTFHNGLGLLKKADIAIPGRTPDRLVIAPKWVPSAGPGSAQ